MLRTTLIGNERKTSEMRPTRRKVYFGMYEKIVTQSVLVFELKDNKLIIYIAHITFFFLQ